MDTPKAILVAAVIIVAAILVTQRTEIAAGQPGRYWRLNTITGGVSVCGFARPNDFRCVPAVPADR